VLHIATELMGLSKLNWNNTQFDGGEPITARGGHTQVPAIKWRDDSVNLSLLHVETHHMIDRPARDRRAEGLQQFAASRL
jgi:hypothetical protein